MVQLDKRCPCLNLEDKDLNCEFVFNKEKIEIFVEDWSDTQYFVYAEYDHHNLYMAMTMCDFVEDCDYWGYEDVRIEKKMDGTQGWLFRKEEEKEAIKAHIRGFIYEYPFLCEWNNL